MYSFCEQCFCLKGEFGILVTTFSLIFYHVGVVSPTKLSAVVKNPTSNNMKLMRVSELVL